MTLRMKHADLFTCWSRILTNARKDVLAAAGIYSADSLLDRFSYYL
jgi:hypothetical protein